MKKLLQVLSLCFATAASAQAVHKIVVFGDSLSDNGNMYEFMDHQFPISPPYYEGRFSNGPVWVELISQKYYQTAGTDKLSNYAYGGASVNEDGKDEEFTLQREVKTYLEENEDKVSDDVLYVVWIGANNYLALPEDENKSLRGVTQNTMKELERLASKGAKNILFVNIPDLGRTPAAQEADGPDPITRLTNLTDRHNAVTKKQIEVLKVLYPDTNWIYMDVDKIFREILDVSQTNAYHFENTTDACIYKLDMNNNNNAKSILKSKNKNKYLTQLGAASLVTQIPEEEVDCNTYVFFDILHPSARAHQIMADKVMEVLQDNNVEFE